MSCTHRKTREEAILNEVEVIEMYLEAWNILHQQEEKHIFNNEEDAVHWLLEYEYVSYEKLDKQDEQDWGDRTR